MGEKVGGVISVAVYRWAWICSLDGDTAKGSQWRPTGLLKSQWAQPFNLESLAPGTRPPGASMSDQHGSSFQYSNSLSPLMRLRKVQYDQPW